MVGLKSYKNYLKKKRRDKTALEKVRKNLSSERRKTAARAMLLRERRKVRAKYRKKKSYTGERARAGSFEPSSMF